MSLHKTQNNRRATLLPGLEEHVEATLSTPQAGKQAGRQEMARKLAEAIAEGPVELVTGGDSIALVNTETGELQEDRAAAFAALLMLAAEDQNHAAGTLAGEGLEPFMAGLSLWKPSLRLDPNWMETMRRRSRRNAQSALRDMLNALPSTEKAARRYGYRQRLTLKLLTLTMPHLKGRSTLEEVNRINAALELLRKRALWRELVWGGVKGVEDKLDADGPHVHIHALLLTRYISRDALSEDWRECVEVATRKLYDHGLSEDCPNPFIDIRQVRRRLRENQKGRPELVEMEEALQEVSKYITKTSDLIKPGEDGRRIPREWLLELCEVRRWPRMFELLGKARKAGTKPAAPAALDSIHRAYSTGEVFKKTHGLTWEMVEAWDIELDGPDELRLMLVEALKKGESPPPKKPRPPSWRDLLDRLPFGDWLAHVAGMAERGRRFRINWLLEHNPGAMLWDLSGQMLG